MIVREDVRFEGFDANSWGALLGLLRPGPPEPLGRSGTLLVAVDAQRGLLNACVLGRGPVGLPSPLPPDLDLSRLCDEHAVARVLVVREGALEEVAERLSVALLKDAEGPHAQHADPGSAWGDDLSQLRALWSAVREVEAAGGLRTWPPLPSAPLPSVATLRRAFDLMLPIGHAFALVLYDQDQVSTGVAFSRRRDGLDLVVGPRRILEWAGPLSGDYHRDHRALADAIGRHLAPLHLGVYGQRETLERLLRVPDPGAWVSAVAAREVLVHPTPAYVAVALGADAVRSVTRATSELLGGAELLELFRPVGRALRERLPEPPSLSAVLGFQPLTALANALRHPRGQPRQSAKARHADVD